MDVMLRPSDRPGTGVLVVPAGVSVEQPIVFDATTNYETLFIILEPYTSLCVRDYSLAQTVHIAMHEHAQLRFVGGISRAGAKKIDVLMEGKEADADIFYAYVLSGSEQATLVVSQNHKLPDAHSRVELRGVVAGHARMEHSGKILVAPTAAHSRVEHHNKTILISGDSRLISMPDLEVLHQNVQCSHGSAVGPLDEEQIAYVCSRGLAPQAARTLIIKAFLGLVDGGQEKELEELINKVQEIE